MDALEQIVAMLLRREGYWVHTSYKVCLTKTEKVRVGLPSCPRWELDVVAYRPKDNEVLAVECKSFLNSPGVSFKSFSGQSEKGARTYKLFTKATLREVVLTRLVKQLQKNGLILPHPKVQLCLAAAHIRKGNKASIQQHCDENNWKLFEDSWFHKHFKKLAKAKYENDIAIMAVKLARPSTD